MDRFPSSLAYRGRTRQALRSAGQRRLPQRSSSSAVLHPGRCPALIPTHVAGVALDGRRTSCARNQGFPYSVKVSSSLWLLFHGLTRDDGVWQELQRRSHEGDRMHIVDALGNGIPNPKERSAWFYPAYSPTGAAATAAG
jgi:hypothetical protein